jgi:hypothetical protein
MWSWGRQRNTGKLCLSGKKSLYIEIIPMYFVTRRENSGVITQWCWKQAKKIKEEVFAKADGIKKAHGL